MDRTEFLDKVRRRLAIEATPNVAHPLPEPLGRVPLPVLRTPGGDLVDDFARSAASVDASVRRVSSAGALADAFDEVVAFEQAGTAVRSSDPEVALLREASAAFPDGIDPEAADLGITGAAGGIAATGSLVLEADRAGGRQASLLPPAHLALLRSDRIVATPSDWWRSMDRRYPSGPPSQIVFVTGPSRSADIELTLTVGVHGPERLWIIVLEGELLTAS